MCWEVGGGGGMCWGIVVVVVVCLTISVGTMNNHLTQWFYNKVCDFNGIVFTEKGVCRIVSKT